MNVERYLQRIGYQGPLEVNEKVLRNLCWCHVTHAPFYTLDLFGGMKKKLDLDKLYKKIVDQRLGGMCFELNSLYSWLLKQIGFEVELIKGQAFDTNTMEYGKDTRQRHMTLRVTLDNSEKRIVDVSTLSLPLRLDTEEPQYQKINRHRVRKLWCLRDKDWYYCVEKYIKKIVETDQEQSESPWLPKYRFRVDETSSQLEDFQKYIDFYQFEDNEIRRMSFCVLQNEKGLIALIGNMLMEKERIDDFTERRKKRFLTDDAEIIEVLKNKFDVVLDYIPQLPQIKSEEKL